MTKVFFRASDAALDNITAAFDFVHPINVSMRYTRRIITKALENSPELDLSDLRKIIDPENHVHGVNYGRAFVDAGCDAHEENLAWLLLNNLFAIHEGWAERLYEEIFSGYHYKRDTFIKNLEFPGLAEKFTSYYAINGKTSIALDGAFFNIYQSKSNVDFAKLENYMLCYRVFKEMRNCFMHRNFIASQQLIDAYDDYLPVATLDDLGVSEVPIIIAPVLGQPIRLSLRGVIGFSLIVRWIIIISDINLLRTSAAEKEFFDRIPENWKCKTLSHNPLRAKEQIQGYSSRAGFLKPKWTSDYQDLLVSRGFFSIK